MDYIIKEMNRKSALDISKWTYEKPYDFYNGGRSEEFIQELLDGSFYSVIDEHDNTVGLYCFGRVAQTPFENQSEIYKDMSFLDIGLGMRPDLCGKGEGYNFFRKGLEFARNKFSAKKFRLTVAEFNKRAIKLYEKIGFKKIGKFEKKNKDGNINFLIMTMNLKE